VGAPSRLARPIHHRTTHRRTGESCGALAARAGHDDIVDVPVVEGAIRRHDAIITSNPTHIRTIVDATRARLTIETA